MTFKELYCVNCNESLGDYNDKYFSDVALYNVIIFNRRSQAHKRHDIIIRA